VPFIVDVPPDPRLTKALRILWRGRRAQAIAFAWLYGSTAIALAAASYMIFTEADAIKSEALRWLVGVGGPLAAAALARRAFATYRDVLNLCLTEHYRRRAAATGKQDFEVQKALLEAVGARTSSFD